MIVSEEINTIANALRRLVETHGAPNSFGCSEVADAAGYDINAMRVGYLARRYWPDLKGASRCLP